MPAYASTSPIAAAIGVEGLILLMGTGNSPETMVPIANATDLNLPIMAEVVDVTNVGDNWRRRLATLHDMGKINFKIFWVMEEVTHRNAAGGSGGNIADGLRYCLINNVLANFAFVYPDGDSSTDSFAAFVTGFAITGKVGGVFEATIELSNNGAPDLV
jgi:hypothetical protein